MLITVHNRIPINLNWEIMEQAEPFLAALREEGVDRLVQKLYQAVRNQLEEDEMMWEGYFVEQGNGTTNLYIVGVLKHKQRYYSRLMRVKEVFPTQRQEVEEALGDMMIEYLQGLLYELGRTVGPGRGKGGWQSLS
jgi:hypothetical protein